MCLAIPAKVIEAKGNSATIDVLGEKSQAINSIINAKKGEFVLVQQGMIVERISEKDALETLEALRQ